MSLTSEGSRMEMADTPLATTHRLKKNNGLSDPSECLVEEVHEDSTENIFEKCRSIEHQNDSEDIIEGSESDIKHSLDLELGTNFNRYSARRKQLLVLISALACFLSPMSTIAVLPAVSTISAQFHTTGNVINISNAVYCVVMAMSPCFAQPISDFYGRRVVFLICLVFFSVSSVLVGLSVNLEMFFVFRALMGLFGTAFYSVGAQIIGDIYEPKERGNAMGWILTGSQVGPSLGPVLGGAIISAGGTYWRVIFYMLAGLGAINLVMAAVFLPETSVETRMQAVIRESGTDRKFLNIFKYGSFNPWSVVVSLTYPSLSLAGVVAVGLSFSMYVMLTPIRYVVDPRFNLTSPIYGSLFYLAPGSGYLFGTFFGGKLSDAFVKKWIKKRNGRRIPEDRLRAVIIPLGFVYPISNLIYGWTLETEKGGMVVPIIFMFIGGVAQTCTFPALNTYCVDSMPQLKGTAVGGNYFIRFIASAVASAVALVCIQNIGVGWTSTICSFGLWLAFASVLILVKYGEKLREKYS
ncbi:Dtr1p [Sugiyamaella lignohabitans]|uniref:Dtr1p n=1 Tax=Sugiyamaella lignohabitans TaxID=796027 RepID=A0A167E0H2_9ASCO|nr:Dtr1p [Sugiyamaella lignohabitans]ANB13501.1 Dtr1p [Sugiyamaella lignohabitans]